MRTLILLFGTGLACTALVAVDSHATTMEPVAAPLAVAPALPPSTIEATGTIVGVRSQWVGRRIVTQVTLEAETGARTVFLVAGGTVDGIAMHVSGMPRFAVGERARVTLRAAGNAIHFIGLEAGKTLLP